MLPKYSWQHMIKITLYYTLYWRRWVVECICIQLAHRYNYIVLCLAFFVRNNTTIQSLTIHGNGFHTLFHIVRIYNLNIVSTFTELSGDLEVSEALRYTRINA